MSFYICNYGKLFKICKRTSKYSNLSLKKLSTKKEWKTVVGLEVHAQINSNSKLFSGARNDFGGLINNSVALFDAAIPGTLPVLNRRCVEAGILAAYALSCRINPISTFDRKHYFYADLPAGYQITQQRAPLAQDGVIEFEVYNSRVHKKPYRKTSRIKQIQLEQDSGKSLHDDVSKNSFIDLNRAGSPLMELVFEPDLNDGEEAASLIKELMLILEKINVCSCRMQEGALRVDANVSVHVTGEPLGVRTELKNIGSVRGVANAVQYEANRQILILESGGSVHNETRSWDPIEKATVPMRDKEVTQDYRYMPEPNLPPLILNMTDVLIPDLISVPGITNSLPELPEQTRQRLMKDYGFSRDFVVQLVNENNLLNYFVDLTKDGRRKPKNVANVLVIHLLAVLHKRNIDVKDIDLPVQTLGEIIDLKENDEINTLIVCNLLESLIEDNKMSPRDVIDKNGWRMINDDSEIEKICLKVIENNPDLVKVHKKGKRNVVKPLAAIVKKETNEAANMKKVVGKLEEILTKV